MVVVDGCRQAEEVLQDHLDGGEVEEILAPDHMGHTLFGIVKGGGEEIGHDILALARQDHVADLPLRPFGVDAVKTGIGRAGFDETCPVHRKRLEGCGEIQAERIAGLAGFQSAMATGAGIDVERNAFLRGGKRGTNVGARAGTGVKQAFSFKGFEAIVVA